MTVDLGLVQEHVDKDDDKVVLNVLVGEFFAFFLVIRSAC